jgi:hypothetical protein
VKEWSIFVKPRDRLVISNRTIKSNIKTAFDSHLAITLLNVDTAIFFYRTQRKLQDIQIEFANLLLIGE